MIMYFQEIIFIQQKLFVCIQSYGFNKPDNSLK